MNTFNYKNQKYRVMIQESEKGNQLALVYRGEEKTPIVSTSFGPMASFKNQIFPWAKQIIEKVN